ncbi:MAG TPA: methyltransferase domain-containing protein [Thermoanaerobaculia bacterium]|jgi:SAM-dependent methyltransferase|nr:methyltransferase domain-containing protein [Thermoanaerobaculia bacterium]
MTPRAGIYPLKDFRGSSHRQLAAWVRELPAGTRLLELGPGTGQVARLAARDDLQWVGLEGCVDGLGALAERFAGGAIVDLETLAGMPRGFGAALAADVLEHLVDPDRTLAQLAVALPVGAPLLVSVPNVANLTVRLALLFGRFEYAERGILDRTHRVFLTRKTLERRLVAAGFRVERRAVSTLPLRLALPGWPGWLLAPAEALLAGLTRLMPTLFGYQLLAFARRANPGGV